MQVDYTFPFTIYIVGCSRITVANEGLARNNLVVSFQPVAEYFFFRTIWVCSLWVTSGRHNTGILDLRLCLWKSILKLLLEIKTKKKRLQIARPNLSNKLFVKESVFLLQNVCFVSCHLSKMVPHLDLWRGLGCLATAPSGVFHVGFRGEKMCKMYLYYMLYSIKHI